MGLLKRTRARWIDSGENRQVKWKNVRRALLLASVSLSVTLAGIVGWVAQNQREDYENKVAFCHVREDASTELSTFARSVRDFAIGESGQSERGPPHRIVQQPRRRRQRLPAGDVRGVHGRNGRPLT
jgi:hypothetical protein